MGLFDFFSGSDINAEVENFKNAEGAFLIDVRDKDEYASGHIPGSINVPVDNITDIQTVVKDLDAQVYAYCLSGARSGRAVRKMKEMGYTNAKSIGGISSYKGEVEKC